MKKIAFVFVLSILTLFVVLSFSFFVLGFAFPKTTKNTISEEYHLLWKTEVNKPQTKNACGSYSSMAYLFEKNGIIEDPENIKSVIPNKMKNGYVYPWGIRKYLASHDVKTKIYYFGLMKDTDKSEWIKGRLLKNEPVILIVGNNRYLHYVTVLGYSKNGFYVYDSNVSSDENELIEGNRTFIEKDLFSWWKSAEFKTMKINLAISG